MKPHGCVALVALVASGCLGSLGRTNLVATPASDQKTATPAVASGVRVAPPTAIIPITATDPQISLETRDEPPTIAEVPPLPEAVPPVTASHPPTAELSGPPPPDASPAPEPAVSKDSPTETLEARERPIEVAPITSPEPPASVSLARLMPPKPKGRPVASVGDEVITLPELTAATKARLAELGPDAAPSRRQVIAIARSTLKSMIIRSLVYQEGRDKLGGPEKLGDLEARLGQIWASRELPALLLREGVTTEAELRAKLASRQTTPEALRGEFVVRSVASELILLGRLDLEYDAYLEVLRGRRPITSIMTPAQLMAAGRSAALEGEVAR